MKKIFYGIKNVLNAFFGTLEIPNIDLSIEKEIENNLKNRKAITGVQEKLVIV